MNSYTTELSSLEIYNLTSGEADSEFDFITSTEDLCISQDSGFYFLLGKNNSNKSLNKLEIFGSPTNYNLMRLSILFNAFNYTTPHIMFKGQIMNPQDLPSELPLNKSVWVFVEEEIVVKFDTMMKAIVFIENQFDIKHHLNITDFSVIVGEELPFNQKEWEEELRVYEQTNSYKSALVGFEHVE